MQCVAIPRGQFAGYTSLTLLVLNFSSGSVPSRFCSPSICVWFAPEFGLCGALFFVTHGFLHYVQSERCYCISGAQTLETGHSRLPRSVMVISSLCVPAPEWSVSRAWSLRQWFTFYIFVQWFMSLSFLCPSVLLPGTDCVLAAAVMGQSS